MNFLTETEYAFLEGLALETKFSGVENTEYGSLMLESTMGRRFLVEMLFLEGVSALGNTPKNMDVMGTGKGSDLDKAYNGLVRTIKGFGIRILKGREAYEAYIKSLKEGEDQKNGLSLWARFREILSKAGDKFKKLYEAVRDYIKKHPYYSVAIAVAAIIFVTYMITEQKELTKKIANFLKNLVTYPFRKISQGISWVINKIFKNSKKKLSESVLDKQFRYVESLLESVMFLETTLLSENDDVLMYSEKGLRSDMQSLVRTLQILNDLKKTNVLSHYQHSLMTGKIKEIIGNYSKTLKEYKAAVKNYGKDSKEAKEKAKEVKKLEKEAEKVNEKVEETIEDKKGANTESIFKKAWEFIKRYGWEVPKRVILSLVYKYTKLFYGKDTMKDPESKITAIKNEIDKLGKQLENVASDEDKKKIKQQIDTAKSNLAKARGEFIKKHWIPIVITLIILAVVIAAGIYYYRKKRNA